MQYNQNNIIFVMVKMASAKKSLASFKKYLSSIKIMPIGEPEIISVERYAADLKFETMLKNKYLQEYKKILAEFNDE